MDEAAREEHITVLENSDSLQEERIQALFQLMNIADSKSLAAIINCLQKDSCEIVRHEAAFVLGETAAKEAVEALKEAARNDSSGIVRHESILALGTLNDDTTISFLEEMTSCPIKLVSESAKIALQRIQSAQKPYRGPEQFKDLN